MSESWPSDATVLEALLHALLEVAARKDALRRWPRDGPPEEIPRVQARRDEGGSLEIVSLDDIERRFPVGRAAAIALADVDAVRAGHTHGLPTAWWRCSATSRWR